MCMIAYCKPGSFPTDEQLNKIWDSNPDGAGIMWKTEDGKIHFVKGIQSKHKYLKIIKQHKTMLTKLESAIHTRIGTSGGKGPESTHPFPITSSITGLKALKGAPDQAMMHNGVFSGLGNNELVDTQEFILLYLPQLRNVDHIYARKAIIRGAESCRLCLFQSGDRSA